jgi:hypothetical protein
VSRAAAAPRGCGPWPLAVVGIRTLPASTGTAMIPATMRNHAAAIVTAIDREPEARAGGRC